MKAPDTSVLVAAFATWHEAHAPALRSLSGDVRIIGHVAVETYAVLTRLPPPHRAPPELVLEFLFAAVSEPPLVLPARVLMDVLGHLPGVGVTGGTTYDALIGSTAARAGATLVTLDHRAAPTYQLVGADVDFVA